MKLHFRSIYYYKRDDMAAKIKQNESALVCAAREGDKESLSILLTRNWAWLKGMVYSITKNSHDVDDILQDICVRVISKINTLREPERFRPWLAVLARRQAIRYCQRKNQRTVMLDEEVAGQFSDHTAGQLFENLERKESYQQIIQAIKLLPDKYRQVFMLQYSGDLTYGQIAEILDVPITTVQIRLVRARRMIYNQVSGKGKIRYSNDEKHR